MKKVYTASVLVNGLRLQRECRDEDEASMWIRLMTAQYLGRVASPSIACTAYSEIFKAPMITDVVHSLHGLQGPVQR